MGKVAIFFTFPKYVSGRLGTTFCSQITFSMVERGLKWSNTSRKEKWQSQLHMLQTTFWLFSVKTYYSRRDMRLETLTDFDHFPYTISDNFTNMWRSIAKNLNSNLFSYHESCFPELPPVVFLIQKKGSCRKFSPPLSSPPIAHLNGQTIDGQST